MKRNKKILSFTAVAGVIVALMTIALLLMSDTTLKVAASNCDTITITAEYNAVAKSLKATQTVNYKNRNSEPINEVKFHIYANAYQDGAQNPPINPSESPQAYPNGKSFGGITLHDIKTSTNGGKTATTATPCLEDEDATVLCIELDTPLEPNKKVDITMDYTVTLANIKHRLGWTVDAVNLANFYPVPCILEDGKWQTNPYSASGDPFYNAMHNYEVTLTAPKELTIASSGALIKSSQKNNKTTTIMKSTAIRDFAMVLSQKFKTLNKTVKNVDVKYYYLEDSRPEQSLTTSIKALETFSKLFTKYPYGQLSVVQTDFLHGGMEYGELVYISRDLLSNAEEYCDEHDKHTQENCTNHEEHCDARADHDRVIVHEIAHQWWYGLVGNNQTRNAWIDEGLAEYSTLLFYDQNPEYNVDRKTVIENARLNYTYYVNLIKSVGGEVNPDMNRPLDEFNSSYEYVYMTYVRGMLLFCDLENMLSQTTLTRALSDFAHSSKFGIANQAKLVDSIEKSTNAKVSLFFDSYLRGA